ncbi:MAG: ATP-dependent DNA helicase RecG [Phycisphaerae bacterium]
MARRVFLDDQVQFLRGVGPGRARILAGLGIHTVADLIEHFPFRHESRPKSQAIGTLRENETATVIGGIRSVRTKSRFGSAPVTVLVEDGTGRCRVRWFNAPYVADQLQRGRVIRVCGKVGVDDDLAIFTNPVFEVFEDPALVLKDDVDQWYPVYPATGELSSKQIARIIDSVLEEAAAQVGEFVPETVRMRRRLPPRSAAIVAMHHPANAEGFEAARKSLAYQELFLLQMAVLLARHKLRHAGRAPRFAGTEVIDQRIRHRLPFTLTGGQDRCIEEICADLASERPMNRMLQGDVGSGKTVVAAYAALVAVANRAQVALLAPTELLARQHYGKFEAMLAQSRVRMGLLVGATDKKQRGMLLADLERGNIDILIGTHALLEDNVRFAKLGLIIVDEQHKFGVRQRGLLRRKGIAPHCLVLTATPIPRTLAMTVFGDLDLSSIRDLPPGRQPVRTQVVPGDRVEEAWCFVRKRLAAGEQAYIVYPLVEESEQLDLQAAGVEAERLEEGALHGYRVGLLHGRMAAAEKERVMAAFRRGEIQALVATTVVEVGVDVANATVMVIQHAERYGLSQLHQLRGRVGRGRKQAYCLLIAGGQGNASWGRLGVLAGTSDGFRIAEEDLRFRGPGELLGTRQHGMPPLKVADLMRDLDVLEHARADALRLLRDDPELKAPEHRTLRGAVVGRYGGSLHLMDVA